MSSRVRNLRSLPRWILHTRLLVESDTISTGVRPPRHASPSGSKEPKRCVCRTVMTTSSRVPSFLSFPRPTRKTRSRSSSVTKRTWCFPSHARSSGSRVNFLNVRVDRSRPPRFATKRFLPFHSEGISSTSESETSSFLALASYVSPIGSGLWVGQLEVSVILTTDAFVAAAAGWAPGRSEHTTDRNRAQRRNFFIGPPRYRESEPYGVGSALPSAEQRRCRFEPRLHPGEARSSVQLRGDEPVEEALMPRVPVVRVEGAARDLRPHHHVRYQSAS